MTSSTYDGRHDKMTTDEFREYIKDWMEKDNAGRPFLERMMKRHRKKRRI